jgi:hypothetical protein
MEIAEPRKISARGTCPGSSMLEYRKYIPSPPNSADKIENATRITTEFGITGHLL